jgi:hypothetical protein
MDFFNNLGKGSVTEARATVKDFLDRIQPIVDEVVLRLEGVAHGLLNRFEVDIKIKLNPSPKATAVENDK